MLVHPIVRDPKWSVRCQEPGCDFAHDSAADTHALAISEVAERHDPTHRVFTATAVGAASPTVRTQLER
jgi:hypothetical protein